MHCFLRLLEPTLELEDVTRALLERIGASAWSPLVDEHVLVPGGAAKTYPCGRTNLPCRRVLVHDAEHANKPWFAVCNRPDPCPSVYLDDAGIRTHRLDRDALFAMLRRLLGIKPARGADAGYMRTILLGTREGKSVFLCHDPRGAGFPAWSKRVDGTVIVPSRFYLAASTVKEWAPRADLIVLDEVLYVEDGRIRCTLEPAQPLGPSFDRAAGVFRMAPDVVWPEIEIYPLNGDVIGVRIRGADPLHCSSTDLGLAHVKNRKATALWELIMALCAGGGTCSRASTGAKPGNSFRVRVGRLNDVLCEAFRIEKAPIAISENGERATALFVALANPPREWRRAQGG